jgi:hypothetical protein
MVIIKPARILLPVTNFGFLIIPHFDQNIPQKAAPIRVSFHVGENIVYNTS